MLTRTLFLKMSESPTLRALVETRGWPFASRFVAGRTLEEAVAAVRRLNAQGIGATLSHLGEHIHDPEIARRETVIFREDLAVLHRERLDCGLSIKPSQMGLMIDPKIARNTIWPVVEAAAANGQFVRIDMEDSTTTDTTLAMVRDLHRDCPNVGVVIQAYLYRSKDDLNALNDERVSVRLCKGAYNEPPSVAFPKKSEVDENYVLLTRLLLHNGLHPAIATHDERMIQAAIHIAREDLPKAAQIAPRENADRRSWEFQMLYGVRRDLQVRLAQEGYGMRVYVPYGTEWYPYFMRRLAERPANVAFILRNLRRG